ncbi:hypothetical protein BDY21DRAFT_369314 [Lineolata rhizophorae]|uniref:NAD(P)-binding domain-containing protein n=1 Tax=Lineolata rhizophorae TaxID=578093 RepID=A0A6A6P8F2_9PEZI|nr:hypothetical protein BDY21DRAFT_369314 [Lineolata rhizophorae]
MPSFVPVGPAPNEGQPGLSTEFFNGNGIWRDAPVLRGTTKFRPLPEVKSIMITGGAGFIASWIARHLVTSYKETYNIVCFDKLEYCASLSNVGALNSYANFKFVSGDITNPTDVGRCLAHHHIDTIFHFAAQSHVDLSFGNSYEFTETNVLGTHVLLECAREFGIGRFIHVSTDEVYGEVAADDTGLLEKSILAPTNPYAASKAAAEMMVNAYSRSFKVPAIIVRSNNVYGPHQYPEKVIPKFACLLHRNQKLLLHGDGKHTRHYLYASDAVDAFDTILHRGSIGEIYNIGSRDEISNLTLCAKLIGVFGHTNTTEKDVYAHVEHGCDRPFNDRRYAVDGSKLKRLGWTQKTGFDEGLRMTVDWYRKYGDVWWGNIEHIFAAFPSAAKEQSSPGGECSSAPSSGARSSLDEAWTDEVKTIAENV